MSFLNLHHVRYFRVIAQEQSIARAAERLNLSKPALSIQLKQLEQNLGQILFERRRGGLELTEAGRLALEYAEVIGRAGDDLLTVMQHGAAAAREVLRIGAVATLSRNFLLEFLRPALHRPNLEVVVRSGSLRELLVQLHAHQVDLVLSNHPARRDDRTAHHSHLLAEQAVGLVGVPAWKRKRLRFPAAFNAVPLLLPSLESNIRPGFDVLLAAAGVRPQIIAEVDDMATLRLLAREGEGLALVPTVVVRDELESGKLVEVQAIPQLRETFYAITPTRRLPNKIVGEMVTRMRPAAGRTASA
ncbi:MAG: LysR family transcriptional regulator [Opitutaceae bacterium]|nr:LysR family transcriptional regulator [Opitutaceae bacterium]